MSAAQVNLDHLKAFSNGVFAITITLLARDIRSPKLDNLNALLSLWPDLVSYAVSYLFIAIVWINHHHSLRFTDHAALRLVWINFAHLFTVSLIPFATTWIANTELAAVPVSFYAGIFVLVNATYFALCLEPLDHRESKDVSARARKMMRMRSLVTLATFAIAALVSLKCPVLGMALICLCLILYVRPEAPVAKL